MVFQIISGQITQLEPNDWYRPQNEHQITRLRQDLKSISSSVRVLVGCEADTIAPGKFSITQEFANSLDYVGLSCSHFHIKGLVQQPKDDRPRSIGEHLMTFFISAVKSGLATIIVHPFKPYGYETQYDNVIAALSDAMRKLVKLEVFIKFLDLSEEDMVPIVIKEA